MNPSTSTSTPPSRTSTPPLPPQSKPIPTTFTSSLSAWWNNSSYKEARISEERLLRRLKHYTPPEQVVPSHSGWFGWGSSATQDQDSIMTTTPTTTTTSNTDPKATGTKEDVIAPIDVEGSGGLVATLRNVFIQTPNPALAPEDPSELYIPPSTTVSQNSSTSSLPNGVEVEKRKSHHQHHHLGHKNKDKLVDYINTLEVSRADDRASKEAVVVVHGYAAAMG